MEDERLARAAMQKRGEERVPMGAIASRKRKASTSPTPSRIRQITESPGNIREPFPATKTQRESTELPDATPALPNNGMPNPLQFNQKIFGIRNTQSLEHWISSPNASHGTSNTPAKAREHFSITKNPCLFELSGIQYPDGVVKKTWVLGCERQGDDIKIEEVLQKNDLELAVLSAFQLDADWVMSKLDGKTKVVWVLQAKDEAQVSYVAFHLLVIQIWLLCLWIHGVDASPTVPCTSKWIIDGLCVCSAARLPVSFHPSSWTI
jgi:hypothetical protein